MKGRIHRSKDEKIILGVMGGISEYIELDPTLVRLIYILLCLAEPFFVILYFILGIVMPEEENNTKSKESLEKRTNKILDETEESVDKIVDDKGKKIQKQIKGEENENIRYFAISLILIGLFIIVRRIIPFGIFFSTREIIAILLVIIGAYILLRGKIK